MVLSSVRVLIANPTYKLVCIMEIDDAAHVSVQHACPSLFAVVHIIVYPHCIRMIFFLVEFYLVSRF